jgi:hypothetical protein
MPEYVEITPLGRPDQAFFATETTGERMIKGVRCAPNGELRENFRIERKRVKVVRAIMHERRGVLVPVH